MDIFRQHFKVNTYLIKLLEKVFRKQINMQLGNVFMCGSNRGVWGSLEGCMRLRSHTIHPMCLYITVHGKIFYI